MEIKADTCWTTAMVSVLQFPSLPPFIKFYTKIARHFFICCRISDVTPPWHVSWYLYTCCALADSSTLPVSLLSCSTVCTRMLEHAESALELLFKINNILLTLICLSLGTRKNLSDGKFSPSLLYRTPRTENFSSIPGHYVPAKV